jgi:hypothetical protein
MDARPKRALVRAAVKTVRHSQVLAAKAATVLKLAGKPVVLQGLRLATPTAPPTVAMA